MELRPGPLIAPQTLSRILATFLYSCVIFFGMVLSRRFGLKKANNTMILLIRNPRSHMKRRKNSNRGARILVREMEKIQRILTLNCQSESLASSTYSTVSSAKKKKKIKKHAGKPSLHNTRNLRKFMVLEAFFFI